MTILQLPNNDDQKHHFLRTTQFFAVTVVNTDKTGCKILMLSAIMDKTYVMMRYDTDYSHW